MSNQNPQVLLIVAEKPNVEFKDKAGGEIHSNIIKRMFGHEKSVDIDKIKNNLDQCLDRTAAILSDIKKKAIDQWELESVSLSLAVSAEGSIGIATAGVEASIEVTFIPKK